MTVELKVAATHVWAEVTLPADQRAEAAFRVAVHIAWQRCGAAPAYFDAWLSRYQGGDAHADDLRDCLEAFLGSECIGTPANPALSVHLEGFVAEHIWHLLALEEALRFGATVRIDGPDWSVTDSGGDGLAVHRSNGALVFRLWESKAHTGDGEVRDVVNGACRQVTSKALRYLARFSKVGQTLTDPELQAFYGRLPEMWRATAREAGAGISVATKQSVIADCFDNFGSYWDFAHEDQRQGLVVVIDDFASFAEDVRGQLWKGL